MSRERASTKLLVAIILSFVFSIVNIWVAFGVTVHVGLLIVGILLLFVRKDLEAPGD